MAITLDEFKSKYNPDQGEIQFLLSGSQVNAMIVSTQDCQSESAESTLRSMTNTLIIIDGESYSTSIVEIINRGSHYYFELDPFTVSSTGSISNCGVSIYAYDENSTVFTNSEYNPIINNVTEPASIGYIYDVDRKKSQTSPANIQGILSGSSQPALIQLSNYSITGLVNSKYNGAKTNITEYGTVPLISGRIFQGANYTVGTETTLICSLLYNSTFEEGDTENDFFIQRTIDQNLVQEFLFTSNPRFTVTPTNNIPQIRAQELDFVLTDSSLNNTDTRINIQGSEADGAEIQPGDIIKLVSNSGNTTEYIKVTKFNPVETVGGEIIGPSIDCRRGYRAEIEGGFQAATHDNTLTFSRIAGDIVFKLEGNSFYKLSESLIAVAENEKVFYIDEDGSLFLEVRDCTIS